MNKSSLKINHKDMMRMIDEEFHKKINSYVEEAIDTYTTPKRSIK